MKKLLLIPLLLIGFYLSSSNLFQNNSNRRMDTADEVILFDYGYFNHVTAGGDFEDKGEDTCLIDGAKEMFSYMKVTDSLPYPNSVYIGRGSIESYSGNIYRDGKQYYFFVYVSGMFRLKRDFAINRVVDLSKVKRIP